MTVPATATAQESPANERVVRQDAPVRHGPECPCTRCTGFPAGHQVGLRHGAYAPLRISARATEIAEALAVLAPDVPGVVLQVMATTLVRVEVAQAACDEVDAAVAKGGSALAAYLGSGAPPLERLRADLRGWTNVASRFFEQLGMTEMAAARISEALADRSTRVQVNLVAAPEWVDLRERILDALEPHPDALADVMKMIAPGAS